MPILRVSIKELQSLTPFCETHKHKHFVMRMGSSWCISSVRLFLLLLLNVTPFLSFVQTLCHVDEGSALLQFKESLTVIHKSPHPKFASWTAQEGQMNLTCCSWDGVKCGEDSGHVIGLDLRGSYLYGSINSTSSLFRLVHLQRLDLSDNDFSLSEIPSQLGYELMSLSYLNLSHCSFFGEFPVGIFHLPNLQVLDLDSNHDLRGYFPDFNSSNALEYLNVARTGFSHYLPSSIGNLRSLKFLNLEYCEFQPHLPSSLGNLTDISYLDLSFFFDRKFTHSYISPDNFSLLDTDSWSWVGKLAKLYHLGLGHTYLKGEFPSFVANLTQLSELSLDYNQITGQLPSWLFKFTQLTLLNLRFNNLQGGIPRSIVQLHNLEFLDLSSNNLTGSVEFDIFSNLKKLRALHLSFNKLSLQMKSGLSAPKFEVLKLGSCNLTEFPEFLKNNSGLVELDLSDNYIQGQIPKWMWNSTRETLLYLNLSRNSLNAFDQNPYILPWRNLLVFQLGFNSMRGSLPTPPPTIQIYSVPNNRYSGEISLSFCNLSDLHILDLSNNSLSGLLPQCLGNSDALEILNLQNNYFRGEIPPMCTNGTNLKSVDLSHNLLQGKLPTSMAICTRLEFLDLAKNQISDILPSWLWALPVLRVLSLRSNRFHGTIGKPATNLESSKLCIIDLSKNALSGMLPSNYMENWNCLKSVAVFEDSYFHDTYRVGDVTFRYDHSLTVLLGKGPRGVELNPLKYGPYFKLVDFSSNKFEGNIPGNIGNFVGLQSIDLSNNILTGKIPSSLGYLTELESLDLSRNQLSGDIPSTIEQLNWLLVFNVSHNHLRGPIPHGKQLDMFDKSSYEGNSGLCGKPLPVKCEDSKTSKPPGGVPPSSFEEYQDPAGLEWHVFFPAGLVSGMVVGFLAGNTLTSSKHEWFVEKFSRSRRRQPRRKRERRGRRNY